MLGALANLEAFAKCSAKCSGNEQVPPFKHATRKISEAGGMFEGVQVKVITLLIHFFCW